MLKWQDRDFKFPTPPFSLRSLLLVSFCLLSVKILNQHHMKDMDSFPCVKSGKNWVDKNEKNTVVIKHKLGHKNS